MFTLYQAVGNKGDDRGHQQDHADDRPHLEVLLANNLLVNIDRQHVVLTTDDFRHAEIGNHQSEHHKAGAHETVLGPRQGHRKKGSQSAGPQRDCSLVQARIGQRQGGGDDDQCMREGPEYLAHNDAHRPVNLHPVVEPLFEQGVDHPLVTEEIHQGDRRQQ